MKFYDCRTAPSPQKVRLFIAEKGLEIDTVEVDLRSLEHQRPEFLAINPAASVPVLELDDGMRLTESLAICHYLEQLHPEPNLMGRDAREQALVLMWNDIQTFEGYLAVQEVLRNAHPAFQRRALVGPEPYDQIPALAERGRLRSARYFERLDAHLASSQWVAGPRFTYADIVGFVYLRFATRTLREDPTEGRAHLRRWRDAVARRPAIESAS
jgi:glutathione S-transferase